MIRRVVFPDEVHQLLFPYAWPVGLTCTGTGPVNAENKDTNGFGKTQLYGISGIISGLSCARFLHGAPLN